MTQTAKPHKYTPSAVKNIDNLKSGNSASHPVHYPHAPPSPLLRKTIKTVFPYNYSLVTSPKILSRVTEKAPRHGDIPFSAPRKRLFRTVKEPLSQRHMHHMPTQNHNCLIIREMCTNKESGNIVLKFRLQLIVTLMDFCIGKARNDKRDGRAYGMTKE